MILRLESALTVLFFTFVASMSLPIFAQTAAGDGAKKLDSKKQTLTFEDELIEGSAQKPELFYLFQKKNFNYKRLIKFRENFIPEMRRTSEDVVKKTER